MAEKHDAEKIAKVFADTRLNEVELANHTAHTFNDIMNEKMLRWFRFHHFVKNGFKDEFPEPIELDNYDEVWYSL